EMRKVVITYCEDAIKIGSGRGINLTDCAIEKNTRGITKLNGGDLNTHNVYFEGNKEFDLNYGWGQNSFDSGKIDSCTFLKSTPGACVLFHGKKESNLKLD